MRTGTLNARQTMLLAANIRWLQQARELVQQLGDAIYAESPLHLEPHKVGGHVRHILEFYECFLDGLSSSHIDYDARRRDRAVATSRHAALERIATIIRRLESEALLHTDAVIWVRMEDSVERELAEPFLTSSIGRELQTLSSHTIHHFALIAVTLRAHGLAVDTEFGM